MGITGFHGITTKSVETIGDRQLVVSTTIHSRRERPSLVFDDLLNIATLMVDGVGNSHLVISSICSERSAYTFVDMTALSSRDTWFKCISDCRLTTVSTSKCGTKVVVEVST